MKKIAEFSEISKQLVIRKKNKNVKKIAKKVWWIQKKAVTLQRKKGKQPP